MTLPAKIFLPGGKALLTAPIGSDGKCVVNAEDCCCDEPQFQQCRVCATNVLANVWVSVADATLIGASAFKVPDDSTCYHILFTDGPSTSPGTVYPYSSLTTFANCCRCYDSSTDCCCGSSGLDCSRTVAFGPVSVCSNCNWISSGADTPNFPMIIPASTLLNNGVFDLPYVGDGTTSDCRYELLVPGGLSYNIYQDPTNNCATLVGTGTADLLIRFGPVTDLQVFLASHLSLQPSGGDGYFGALFGTLGAPTAWVIPFSPVTVTNTLAFGHPGCPNGGYLPGHETADIT